MSVMCFRSLRFETCSSEVPFADGETTESSFVCVNPHPPTPLSQRERGASELATTTRFDFVALDCLGLQMNRFVWRARWWPSTAERDVWILAYSVSHRFPGPYTAKRLKFVRTAYPPPCPRLRDTVSRAASEPLTDRLADGVPRQLQRPRRGHGSIAQCEAQAQRRVTLGIDVPKMEPPCRGGGNEQKSASGIAHECLVFSIAAI